MTRQELQAIRQEAGWTLQEMATILGKRLNTVWRYEHGVLDIPQLVALMALLMRDKKNRRLVEKYLDLPLSDYST